MIALVRCSPAKPLQEKDYYSHSLDPCPSCHLGLLHFAYSSGASAKQVAPLVRMSFRGILQARLQVLDLRWVDILGEQGARVQGVVIAADRSTAQIG